MLKTKIRKTISVQRILALALLITLVVLSLSSSIGAQTSPTFTQGYLTDQPVQKGMIVRLKDGDTTKIEPLTPNTIDKMYGVIVDPNDAAVTLSSDGKKVFVANTSKYEVLVSNQAGTIAAGDYITLSALHGVGMKAGEKDLMVVGRALAPFDDTAPVASTTKIKDSAGGERDIKLGRIVVDITVARNPLLKGSEPNLPEVLRKVSESVAGKPVEATRVYIALVVLIITTAVSGSLLYGGIRSGIISIGRNPLSKKMIIRGMIQVIIAGLIIFIIGLFGVYLLLKL